MADGMFKADAHRAHVESVWKCEHGTPRGKRGGCRLCPSTK